MRHDGPGRVWRVVGPHTVSDEIKKAQQAGEYDLNSIFLTTRLSKCPRSPRSPTRTADSFAARAHSLATGSAPTPAGVADKALARLPMVRGVVTSPPFPCMTVPPTLIFHRASPSSDLSRLLKPLFQDELSHHLIQITIKFFIFFNCT
jgi:hypothetical protein